MYGNNYRGDSGGDVMLPGYQDIPSNRCFNIVNVPGGVDIERDDDIIPYIKIQTKIPQNYPQLLCTHIEAFLTA